MTYHDAKQLLEHYKTLGSVYGLDNIQRLLTHLERPEKKLHIIHVAGTNGKGSTVTTLATVLEHCGYRTATYTSPEVTTYLDRFRIHQHPASEKDFLTAFEHVELACQKIVAEGYSHPTIFEMEVAIAYLNALAHQVDVLIQETGLGGRLDATNAVAEPILTIFTAIGLDHTHLLGNSIEKIAYEKAGIIKERCPVVSYDNGDTINNIIAQISHEKNCSCVFASSDTLTVLSRDLSGQTVQYEDNIFHYPLIGTHQTHNLALILKALQILAKNGWLISVSAVQKALQEVYWPGRFEVIQKRPCIILDGAHNPQAAQALCDTVKKWFPQQKAHLIVHIFQDKDAEGILSALAPICDDLILTSIHEERSMTLDTLQVLAKKCIPHASVQAEENFETALKAGQDRLLSDDILIICGSLSHLEQARHLLI